MAPCFFVFWNRMEFSDPSRRPCDTRAQKVTCRYYGDCYQRRDRLLAPSHPRCPTWLRLKVFGEADRRGSPRYCRHQPQDCRGEISAGVSVLPSLLVRVFEVLALCDVHDRSQDPRRGILRDTAPSLPLARGGAGCPVFFYPAHRSVRQEPDGDRSHTAGRGGDESP